MAEKNKLDLSVPAEITGVREINAPRDLVFSVFTDPKHLSQWWGPDGFTTTTSAFEFRPGGDWRFVMHGPDGRDYQNRVTFDDIVRPERIAYHHGGGDDVEPVKFSVVITFEDLAGRTRLTWRMVLASTELRDALIKEYSADAGLVQTMAHLAAYAERMAAP